jgi:hypothetical protein
VGLFSRKDKSSTPRGSSEPREISSALLAEAAAWPGGWVYEIDSAFDPDGAVPPTAILGAWKVGDDGRPTGEYQANPNYVRSDPGDA